MFLIALDRNLYTWRFYLCIGRFKFGLSPGAPPSFEIIQKKVPGSIVPKNDRPVDLFLKNFKLNFAKRSFLGEFQTKLFAKRYFFWGEFQT